MNSFITLSLMVVLVAVMADPNVPYGQQQHYARPVYQQQAMEHKPVYNQHQTSSYKQSSHDDEPGPIATAEEMEKLRCFALWEFFSAYCPDFAKYANYKVDIKFPTEQFWGKYQFEFDGLVASGCKAKHEQDNFHKCLNMGFFLKKYDKKPEVFNP